jgi:hypothetical protein
LFHNDSDSLWNREAVEFLAFLTSRPEYSQLFQNKTQSVAGENIHHLAIAPHMPKITHPQFQSPHSSG